MRMGRTYFLRHLANGEREKVLCGQQRDLLPQGVALPHMESDLAFFTKHSLCGSFLRFQPTATSPISPRQKDRKHLKCVSRGRFLVRQPGEYLSFRRRCLAQDVSKGGEHGRRIETPNQARITSAIIRDSRYFGLCLRTKNATGWLHGEREPTSIGQARRRLVHPFAKHRQVSIEHAVVERSELNLNVCGVLRNRAGELKKRQQTSPGSLALGSGNEAITRPHRQIRQSHFEDRHRVIFPAI